MKRDSLTQTLRGVLLGLFALAASLVFSGGAALAWLANRVHTGSGTLAFVIAVGLSLFALRHLVRLGLQLYRGPSRGMSRSALLRSLERHPQRTVQIHAARNDLDGALAIIAPHADARRLLSQRQRSATLRHWGQRGCCTSSGTLCVRWLSPMASTTPWGTCWNWHGNVRVAGNGVRGTPMRTLALSPPWRLPGHRC